MGWQHRKAEQDHGALPIDRAPKDGSTVVAYTYLLREVRVHWNGRFWDEGNGEMWDTWQLVGWRKP